MSDPYKVIVEPVISEKSTLLQEEENTYVFKVDQDANKHEIKEAITELFDVNVKDVRTVNMPGKPRRVRLTEGETPDWKKAYIKIQQGQAIPIFEG